MPSIRTVQAPLCHEGAKIKGSRFLAAVAPAASAAAALAFVEARRAEFRDATHNCFAWRLATGDGGFRYSDDGEPSGTAGRPILQEIDGRSLAHVVLVVTRYYGGTKLGTGGLVRAYGGAAAAALEAATIIEVPVVRTVRLTYAYELTGAVESVLTSFHLHPTDAAYGTEVKVELAVPVEEVEALQHALREVTAGRIAVVAAVPDGYI